MDKPQRKIRVVGERRAELDTQKFAEAIVSFAMHRLHGGGESTDRPDDQDEHGDEERSA
jgi:hypothetical protein